MSEERFPINLPDDELRRYLRSIDRRIGGAMGFYAEAVLSADLSSNGTVSIGGRTFNGKFIRSGYKLASGTVIGGIWNGSDYSVIAWNVCEEVA